MTQAQLQQIIKFAKPYYKKTGKWHAWNHVEAVRQISLEIAKKESPKVDQKLVQAAAILHDMGRVVKDEGHAQQSGKIAKPFLKKISIPEAEIEVILDAVTHHGIERIDKSKTVEARIVFDADKIEILTVYGFIRVVYWLVEERHMELGEAVNFLWGYCKKFKSRLYSNYAKKTVAKEWPLLEQLVRNFNLYEKAWRQS